MVLLNKIGGNPLRCEYCGDPAGLYDTWNPDTQATTKARPWCERHAGMMADHLHAYGYVVSRLEADQPDPDPADVVAEYDELMRQIGEARHG